MPKKILLLTAMQHGKPYVGSAHEASMLAGCLRSNAAAKGEYNFYTTAINEIVIQVSAGTVSIRDMRNDCLLEDYALVHFRGVLFARDQFMAVARYLEHKKVPFVDVADVQGTPFGKIAQMVQLALEGVSVPDSIAVWADPRYTALVASTFALPCILKANHGTKGHSNYLVRSWEEFNDILMEHGAAGYIAQPFMPNDGDYRVLYVGAQRLVFYRTAQSGTHLNNSSQGGQGRLVPLDQCQAGVLKAAAHAMKVYGRELGGVDVLVDSTTDIPYILEINDTPAIFTGLFQSEKRAVYLDYIAKKVTE